MNEELQKYLDEGLAESYVLGLASPEERQIAESLAARYPEFKAELESIQAALEGFAMADAVEPPPHLKNKIQQQLFVETVNKKDAEIKTLSPVQNNVSGNSRFLIAAVITLLLVSFGFNLYLASELKQVRTSLADLQNSRDDFANALNIQQASYKQVEQTLAVISKPEIHKILLAGNDKLPGIKTTVFWDSTSHAVYINTASVPALPEGKQYQLWALKDGKPIDAGVFDGGKSEAQLIRVKDILGAQAFAVTVEPQGGLPSPTMETLCLIGNVL